MAKRRSTADAERRHYHKHLPGSREMSRKQSASIRQSDPPVWDITPSPKEARRCLASLYALLGWAEVSRLLCVRASQLENLLVGQYGRQLIGLLWCVVVVRPRSVDELFTFGRFREEDDASRAAGDDYSI